MKGQNMVSEAFDVFRNNRWKTSELKKKKSEQFNLGCVKTKDFKGIKKWSDPKAYDQHFTLPLKEQWSGKLGGKLGFSGN